MEASSRSCSLLSKYVELNVCENLREDVKFLSCLDIFPCEAERVVRTVRLMLLVFAK